MPFEEQKTPNDMEKLAEKVASIIVPLVFACGLGWIGWNWIDNHKCSDQCGIHKSAIVEGVCHCKVDNGWNVPGPQITDKK